VVRLLLLRSADVARYCLPDHRISPCPPGPSAKWPILVILRPNATDRREESQALEEPQTAKSRKPRGRASRRTLEAAHIYFIALPAKSVRNARKESSSEANADSDRRKRPETEHADGSNQKSGKNREEL
jgi:hypothetical protein